MGHDQRMDSGHHSHCPPRSRAYQSSASRKHLRESADLAEVMKKLAKDKMLRALSNVTYAKGDYEKEMDQAALKKEAKMKSR